MNNKFFQKQVFFAIAAGMLGAGCNAVPPSEYNASSRTPDRNLFQNLIPQTDPAILADSPGGIVVAEADAMGRMVRTPDVLTVPDCSGLGVGVSVKGTTGDDYYLFDADGNPCEPAKTLFDGTTPKGKRQADPGVNIHFIDGLGPIPETEQIWTDRVIPVEVAPSEYPDEISVKTGTYLLDATPDFALPPRDADKLEEMVGEWKTEAQRSHLMRESERLLQDLKDVRRLSTNELVAAHQEKIEELMAKLREAEQTVETQRDRQARLLEQMRHTRSYVDGERVQQVQEVERLQINAEQLSLRLQEMERANFEMQQRQNQKEKIYQQQIAELSGDLKAAERAADSVRNEMVLEAAQKIAEAERLAFEAKMAEREAMAREAQRLKQEADTIMMRAGSIQGGRSILLSGMEDIPDLSRPPHERGLPQKERAALVGLEQMPVTIHAEDKTLKNIFDNIFASLAPQIGEWKVAWELSPENMPLTEDTWTIAAEARFDEFLSYVENKIAEDRGIKLAFQRFDRNKLFVISD